MIKQGVDISGLQPEMVLAYVIAQKVYADFEAGCVITSAKDGKHGRGSLHYVGLAIDLRTHMLSVADQALVTADLKDKLGAQYDVVLEGGGQNAHIHLEFQPK